MESFFLHLPWLGAWACHSMVHLPGPALRDFKGSFEGDIDIDVDIDIDADVDTNVDTDVAIDSCSGC